MTRLIQILFITFSLGVIFYHSLSWTWPSVICLSVIIFILSLFLLNFVFKISEPKLIIFIVSALFPIFFIAGFWRAEIANLKTEITFIEKQKTEFTGTIVSEPEKKEFNQRIIFQPDIFTEKILISTDLYKPLRYGDRIKIYGQLQKPENFESDKGIEFDYINFLGKDQIFYQSYYPSIQILEKDGGFITKIFAQLFTFKKYFMRSVEEVLPSPHAELVGGILLGLKSSLGKQLELDFRRVGLIHIVVLSGYNITIIAVAILAILIFLPITWRLVIGLIAIALFAVLVGGGATVIRATFMSAIAITGQIFHKKYDVNRALYIAGIAMIFINPKILLFDPSFQLSFLATYGLINFSDPVKNIFSKLPFLRRLPETAGFKEIVTSTIATQIAVFPLLAYMMGEISVISLLVNVITLPLIPLAMLLGFLTGFINIILSFTQELFSGQIAWPFQILSRLIGFLAYLILDYVIKITETFSRLPFATVEIPRLSWPYIVLFYSAIIIFFNHSPIQIFKKVINVLPFSTWLIISYKRMLPHIKHKHRRKPS